MRVVVPRIIVEGHTATGKTTMERDANDANSDEAPDASMASTAEVRAAVGRVQQAHRDRVRWKIGKHTAELALSALDDNSRGPRRPGSKSRRRKRFKRLL